MKNAVVGHANAHTLFAMVFTEWPTPHPNGPGIIWRRWGGGGGGGGEARSFCKGSFPICADLRRGLSRVADRRFFFASAAFTSSHVVIMVDILMLMFFAIMALVFLSYNIYML